MKVKYSFIVPVYNVEKYISKCIDSLLAQTYRLFEIIIVDDGSPDASGNIADSYQSKYPGIVKVIHQKNTGQGGARNHGIELAQGEYILFVDGDDFVVPNMLEIIDTYTGKYNNDLLFFQWETIKEKKLVECADVAYLGDYSTMSLVEYVYQQPSPCRKVYKASIFRNKQLRFPSRIFYEDLSLAPCLVSEAKSIGVIQEKLYFYVQHKSSTMHSKDVNRISELQTIPAKMQKVLEDKERIQWFAAKYANAHDVFFVGRGIDYAVCLEGSLKLKEISYIHSEAYAAGELKHGTISLIEQGTLVIGVLTQSGLYEKTVSNMLECKSRGSYLMGLTTYGKYEIEDQVNFTVYVPKVDEHFVGSLAVIPLQLLGYYVSVAKGLDVDKPRNLAKSVTVE